MEDWIKIQTFDRVYQAELCKDILQKNDIEAVVINARDSLFLIGDIELYIKREQLAKAKALIDEFEGLSKINSFILKRPIEIFKEYLAKQGIESFLKQKEDSRFILENFELYVKNEDLERVIPILLGESFEGWTKIDSCSHTRQTRFRIEILMEQSIVPTVIKKRDSNFHLEEIQIWVENKEAEKASKLLITLNGWIKIAEYETEQRVEIMEDFLGKHGIRSIIKKANNNNFELWVECHNEENTIELITENKNWIKLDMYDSIIEAEFCQRSLAENNINAIIINQVDSSLLLGGIVLFVDEDDVEKAKQVLSELSNREE